MVQYFGIRHHGPGSCRNVVKALNAMKPDLILLEGPAEATPLLPLITHADMKPPVALLAYQTNKVDNASFYPFAEFSPEWQTLVYSLKNDVECRFFDLPLSYMMAIRDTVKHHDDDLEVRDPFDLFARIEQLPDGETWWDTHVECAACTDGIFQAVESAVAELRKSLPQNTSQFDLLREAWMRKMLRKGINEGFQKIAVVCGAWHVPGIKTDVSPESDNNMLKSLPHVNVDVTWIPWTYSRLMMRSGYGAGIEYPGWYAHLYRYHNDDGTQWLSKAARLLREKNIEISTAHVADAVRLAIALAKIRGVSIPSCKEFNDAIVSVFAQGNDEILKILRIGLLISNKLGTVPANVPKVPLLVDFENTQKRLRVPFADEERSIVLDLRKPLDLDRSVFFFRLKLMGLAWAIPEKIEGKGTFKEAWTLAYMPEINVQIIELAIFGNTVEKAAITLALSKAKKATTLSELSLLLDEVIYAKLHKIVDILLKKLDSMSVLSNDVDDMLEVIPRLVNVVLYGDVRNERNEGIAQILESFLVRITTYGVRSCCNIDEEKASILLEKIMKADNALMLVDDSRLIDMWNAFVKKLSSSPSVNSMISGYASRLLYDKRIVKADDMITSLSFYTSSGNQPMNVAYWFEGFLQKSGTILLLDDNLWTVLNTWIQSLEYDVFIEVLPVIRRTFSSYSQDEKNKLAQKAVNYTPWLDKKTENNLIPPQYMADVQRGMPLLRIFLGIPNTNN